MKYLFILLSIFTIHLYSNEIQQISSLESPVPLSSDAWELTTEMIEPYIYSISYLQESKDSINWTKYKVPSNLYDHNLDKSTNQFWIRKMLQLPDMVMHKNKSLSVRLGIISDKDMVYFNGHLIGKTGDMSSHLPGNYDKIRIYEIPIHLIRADNLNILLIHIKGYFPYEAGIIQDKVQIGITEQIQKEYYTSEFIKISFSIIYLSTGMYFLFLFIRRQRDLENLYYVLFIISLLAYQFMKSEFKYELGLNILTLKNIEYTGLMISIPLFYHFIRTLFNEPEPKIILFCNSIILIIACYYALDNDLIRYDSVNKNLVQPIWGIYIISTILILFKNVKKRNVDSIVILFSVFVLLISIILDIASERGLFVLPLLTGTIFILFIFSITIVLANKFVRINNEIEDLNKNLEQKVDDRTKELNDSLIKVSELKKSQDGDYFLTSLLLNPLNVNRNESELVQTEIYCNQKKKFEFKNRNYQIGGDLCITSNIVLKNKMYVLALNGDAMGKSIQGAGGAIVLGTVFNSILSRTNQKEVKNKTPEKWLYDTFMEFQRVFETFQGSMYISLVICLIDVHTNYLYYINAEHPNIVLYRNKKSKFLDQKIIIRKIGTPEIEDTIFVQTFQLKKGDVLYIGSDGRDDIKINEINGIRVINEDEYLFLNHVEQTDSNLVHLVEKIQTSGEITDDLSLIRIQIKENQTKATLSTISSNVLSEIKKPYPLDNDFLELMHKINSHHPDNEITNRILSMHYLKQKSLVQSMMYLDRYNYYKPDSIGMLYIGCVLHKKYHDIDKAIELAEQLNLRRNNTIRFKKLMYELYLLSGNIEKAREFYKNIHANFPHIQLADFQTSLKKVA